ncbi:MAG: hypothetical protein OFPII_17280 [Osedax symbiont Rs1]|nr:MAG: hypothetical protein OFPII_17280 [Osedax symbiont Rs1]
MALIYFIPGTMCNRALWSFLWPKIASHHQLVHLSIIDHGTMAEVVDDLVAKIELSSDGKCFNLIGFSLGGYLATAVSLRFSSQLARLMILSNTPKVLPDEELAQRKLTIQTVVKYSYTGLKSSRIVSLLDKNQHSNQELIRLIQAMALSFNEKILLHHLGALSKRVDLCSIVATEPRPTWFCFGDSDTLVDRNALQEMQTSSRHIQLHKVLNCGHFLPLEQPTQAADLVKAWLQETV